MAYPLNITSIVGLFLHATQGHTAWGMGAVLMIGALLGSAIAPRFLSRLNPQKVTLVLRPIMGLFLILMGLKLVIHLCVNSASESRNFTVLNIIFCQF
ncbi:MAG: TSUP family transporter [Liquorilactobacillus sp.]|uniref:TSUP family transporter n=1 Tax=Liquorilactobacillus sp. TaxID=2767923 RepID=UPI0039EA3E71